MRRRRNGRELLAEGIVALLDHAEQVSSGLGPEERRAFVNRVLAEAGTDPLEAIRARRWIHRGRRPHEQWKGL